MNLGASICTVHTAQLDALDCRLSATHSGFMVLVTVVFHSLRIYAVAKKALWKMKQVTRGQVNLTTRKRILNCYFFSVLKYGCESWALDKSLQKKDNGF